MLQPNFDPFPTLSTQRLVLRTLTKEDAPSVFAFRSHPGVMKYIHRPIAQTITDAENYIELILHNLRENNGITWGITLKEKPEIVIGTIGFWRLEKENYRGEIGYALHADYWQQGITREAIFCGLDYAFNQLKLHSVEARIDPENIGSATILKSTGFVQEAYFKEDFFYDGIFKDTVVYSRLQG